MISLRDRRQLEFAEQFIKKGWWGILYLCPRFGKVRTTINILKRLPNNALIIIAYPDNKIKKSWLNDFKEMDYDNVNVTFTTHLSLKKYKDCLYDLIVLD